MSSFPHYQQLDAMDCGPTCLRIVARFYGKSYSLHTLRDRCHITREGVSLLGISDAAESIGFRTAGVRLTWEQLREQLSLPCIVHWHQRHFIVVYDIRKQKKGYKISVSDPASGLLVYDEKPFLNGWLQSSGDEQDVTEIRAFFRLIKMVIQSDKERFRKEIILSGSALAIDVYGAVDNQLNRQTAFAMQELTRDLNRVVLFGRRVEANGTTRGEAGGLYFFGTQEGGLAIDAAGARLDSYIVNDAAQAILGEGGNPTQILCSPGQARVLSCEFKDHLRILRSDEKRGAYVAVIVNEVNGRGMTIMADPDVPDTDVWVIDPAGFGLSNLKGRAISDEDATPKGFDGVKRMALGELTFEFKNAKQRLCRIKGVMPSATALAGIKANLGAVTVANTEDNPIPTKAVTE